MVHQDQIRIVMDANVPNQPKNKHHHARDDHYLVARAVALDMVQHVEDVAEQRSAQRDDLQVQDDADVIQTVELRHRKVVASARDDFSPPSEAGTQKETKNALFSISSKMPAPLKYWSTSAQKQKMVNPFSRKLSFISRVYWAHFLM